ncbi:hypothetical protein H9645_13635 [Luteimonas sp. Sa2BVA3]|uniref:Uncharacterized protein n=1 Tax=Luteimonas colneyensis TaxID=2762230 RepID=A0ABR8UN25_9GAMM|nr:hypothetical protein [Luteimonas colneyensis]MBD7989074.1 hypothetical protein [Luteimonas colneyensis]
MADPRPVAAPDAAQARRILALLHGDDVDAAITAGLAGFRPLDALAPAQNAALVEARDRLLAAWAARERHRARATRLQRIERERASARAARQPPAAPAAGTGSATADAGSGQRPALPAVAAAALARARARAGGSSA